MQSVTGVRRTLEFGIYRDGDNNLDRSQAITLTQALQVSAQNARVEFTIEDTTSRNSDSLETRTYGSHRFTPRTIWLRGVSPRATASH